ncbi:glycine-rich RNA-binding protein 7 isoform 1 [Zea mays]|uniref:Glycine-rich RNA-binding protein 7 n=1 Tax=Zea mays TaxID=4577 RepID=B6TRJ5_MAIZE|nr:glycine-rich RNA-binding protein 7 isoform 1 [Zea mays]ACG39728.1 glycine-rich RNA-binding protein 7 [Zea mays]|eukprot:NP_001150604.1 glycine-rich RNA-binding protein 7 isoform 1 [Zea mays]
MAEDKVRRIFVGGLSWKTTERTLERTFGQYGNVIEAQVVVKRETGRSRGFGFVTFSEPRAVDAAIRGMHNAELDGRNISVNKAHPRIADDDYGYGGGGGGGYSSGARGGYRSGGDVVPAVSDECFKCGHSGHDVVPAVSDECFKCGRSGHWARECPYSDGSGRTGRYSPASRYGGGAGGRGDRVGGSDRFARYDDDRYDGGRSVDSRDTYYGAGRDRYARDRHLPATDHHSGDRYSGADRYTSSGFAIERSYERDGGRSTGTYYRDDPRGTGGYGRGGSRGGGGGPARFGGSYRDRPAPYDRPSRGGAARAYDDRY